MEKQNSSNSLLQRIAKKLRLTPMNIAAFFLTLAVVLGYEWYQNGGHNPGRTVDGQIFSEQMMVNGKWESDHCYFAFGSKKQGYGSLYFMGYSKSKMDSLNSGDLSNRLLAASQNYDDYWDTNEEGNIIYWPNGLAIPGSEDSPMFPKYSISVEKISGIFTKTIRGEVTLSNFMGGSKTHETRLVHYAEIEE